MQNAWEKNDGWSAESKTEVPTFNDGFTLPPLADSKSRLDTNSYNGTVSHTEYPKSVFTSEVEEVPEKPVSKPSFPRMCLRVWQIIASVGTFAFQAGASPVSLVGQCCIVEAIETDMKTITGC